MINHSADTPYIRFARFDLNFTQVSICKLDTCEIDSRVFLIEKIAVANIFPI